MAIREKLFNLGDYIARHLSTGLVRPVSLPLIYQTRVSDGFIYESGNMINMAFAYCSNNKMSGDYAEFGVFRGHTTIEAWKAAHRHGLSAMRFRLFDSFEGLPEISGKDVGGPFETGEFSFGRKGFEKRLKKFGVDLKRFHITEGFFDETLPKTRIDSKIAVAWIDCDLYESTVPVLDWLTDKLVDGAVICFDDWYTFSARPDKGEQRACAEWLEANPQIKLMEYREFHWAGKSFIVHQTPGD
ncbi:MAG: TylF/MycF/NovP-related O-methyltransferase [Pyrinomonadaceae bacterium]